MDGMRGRECDNIDLDANIQREQSKLDANNINYLQQGEMSLMQFKHVEKLHSVACYVYVSKVI